MKSSSASNFKNQQSIADGSFMAVVINESLMKKLANTSPFLLLLFPVFMMMVFTLIMNTGQDQNDNSEIVVKPVKTSTAIVKQATAIFK